MCHSAIPHILNYCSAVCDTHHVSLLEGVQKFAGRIITKNWKSLHPQLEAMFFTKKAVKTQDIIHKFYMELSLHLAPPLPRPLSCLASAISYALYFDESMS